MSTPKTAPNRHGSAVITFPSDTEYVITRLFDAPADLVFKALTTPELIKRWWGFETAAWQVCEHDVRVGGQWRHLTKDAEFEVGFHGEYLEISPPNRLVFTEMFEGVDPLPAKEDYPVNTVTLDEADGVTTMKVHVKHKTKEERDAVIASGMESGMQVSYDRLEDLVRPAS